MKPSPNQQLNKWLQQRRISQCHRQLLVISGNKAWVAKQGHTISQQYAGKDVLWIGEQADQTVTVAANRYRQYLGQEYEVVVYNCFSGLKANALMALSGVIKRSGLMLLLTPNLEDWPVFLDPLSVNRTSFGYQPIDEKSHFLCMLVNKLEACTDVAQYSVASFQGRIAEVVTVANTLPAPFMHQQQKQAVANIVKVVTGHRQRPFVLTADRGRGKSSALGIATAMLLQKRNMTIIVTAPTPAAVAQVFSHAERNLPDTKRQGNVLHCRNGKLCFIAPDELVQSTPEGHLLLVDEAAAIPTPLLCQITLAYNRIVFSSTIHGYEGSGRGFEFRFKPFLDQYRPNWHSLHMSIPIRWYPEDSLEAFWFDAMLMNDSTTSDFAPLTSRDHWQFCHFSSEALIKQPELLHQIFQLLVNAHYQTVPDDLVRLLDGHDMQIFALFSESEMTAVLLCNQEGGRKLAPVAEQIASGKRRVQGHLAAQGLSYGYADPKLATLDYLRIVRIAVKPQYARQGVGKWALEQLESYARQQRYDVLCTSYGVTPELLSFWHQNHFVPIKLGLKKDAASGEHSLIMHRPLSPDAQAYLNIIAPAFAADIAYHASNEFRHMHSLTLWQIYHTGFGEQQPLTQQAHRQLIQFADEHRGIGSCFPAMAQLALSIYISESTTAQAIAFLFALAVQQKDHSALCLEHGLSGKKQIENKARHACREVLQYISAERLLSIRQVET